MLVILLANRLVHFVSNQTFPNQLLLRSQAGFLGGYTNLVDKYYTELPYTGSSLGGMVGFTYHKDNIVHDWNSHSIKLTHASTPSLNTSLTRTIIKGTYTFLYQFSEERMVVCKPTVEAVSIFWMQTAPTTSLQIITRPT
jgi:hypothetical protein